MSQTLETDGTTCPKCGVSDIEGGMVDIQTDRAYQGCWCTECGAEWTNEYVFSRVLAFKDGSNGEGGI